MHGRMPSHGEWACVERARNDSNGTDASRKTRKPTRGSDGGWLAGAVENQGNSNETHPEKTKLKNNGCTWWRARKCHSRKLLSERQTLHLRVAGFGDDGAMPVAIAAARYRVAARARALADESGECYLLR